MQSLPFQQPSQFVEAQAIAFCFGLTPLQARRPEQPGVTRVIMHPDELPDPVLRLVERLAKEHEFREFAKTLPFTPSEAAVKGWAIGSQKEYWHESAAWSWTPGNEKKLTNSLGRLPKSGSDWIAVDSVPFTSALCEKMLAHPRLLTSHPTTMALMAANLATFLYPGGLSCWKVGLSPFCVVERCEWGRLFLPAVVHFSGTDLLDSLTVALLDGIDLETASGSGVYALELLGLTAVAHGLYVMGAFAPSIVFKVPEPYYKISVGRLSSLNYAMRVVLGERQKGTHNVRHIRIRGFLVPLPFNIQLPTNYKWAVILCGEVATAYIRSLTINSNHSWDARLNLAGPVVGVAAGLAYVYVLDPGLAADVSAAPPPADGDDSSKVHGECKGCASIRAQDRAMKRSAAWWLRWSVSLGCQLGVLCLTTGLAYEATRVRTPVAAIAAASPAQSPAAQGTSPAALN